MDLNNWLLDVADLYNDTLSAIMGVPVGRFFLSALLFLVVVELIAWLATRGRIDRK